MYKILLILSSTKMTSQNKLILVNVAFLTLLSFADGIAQNGIADNVIVNIKLQNNSGNGIRGVVFSLTAKNQDPVSTFPALSQSITNDVGLTQVLLNKNILKDIVSFSIGSINEDWEVEPTSRERYPPGYKNENELFPIEFTIKESKIAIAKKNRDAELKLKEETIITLRNKIDSLTLTKSQEQLHDTRSIQTIDSLETIIKGLEQKIEEIKQNNKNSFVVRIAAELNSFKEDLLNLQQMLVPKVVHDAFLFQDKRDYMSKLIQAYSESRNQLAANRNGTVEAREIWEGKAGEWLTTELDKVYSFALDTINHKLLLKLNHSVLERINDVGTSRKPRLGTQSKAVRAMREMKPVLDAKISEFVKLSDSVLSKLTSI